MYSVFMSSLRLLEAISAIEIFVIRSIEFSRAASSILRGVEATIH